MSQLEVSQASNVFSQDLTIQAAGTSSTACPNLVVGCSKILGVKLKTSGGAPGDVCIASITGPAANAVANGATVVLRSATADTSVYTLFWVNEKTPNALLC